MNDLVEFYRKYNLVESGLSDDELEEYFHIVDKKGNLFIERDAGGRIIGFCEYWRINFEQFGRILCDGLIDARVEDTSSGQIAFVANVAVHPDWANGHLFTVMKNRFFTRNYHCKYFCGDSRRKKHHHTINVYKRNELMFKSNKEEVHHG